MPNRFIDKKQAPLLMFDLDGTLIDSAPDVCFAVNEMNRRYGFEEHSDDHIIAHIGEGLHQLVLRNFEGHPEAQSKDFFREFLDVYELNMLNQTVPFPGVQEFLQSWPGPLGIITNKDEAPSLKILQHFGLDSIPWVGVFGSDTLVERKPSPLPLREMMKRASRGTENSFMIGDGLPDMKSANAAGVRSLACLYGYTSKERLAAHSPYGYLHDFQDLNQFFATYLNI